MDWILHAWGKVVSDPVTYFPVYLRGTCVVTHRPPPKKAMGDVEKAGGFFLFVDDKGKAVISLLHYSSEYCW